jgi:hypothetical protein
MRRFVLFSLLNIDVLTLPAGDDSLDFNEKIVAADVGVSVDDGNVGETPLAHAADGI